MVSNSLKLTPTMCPSLLHASFFRSPQSCPTLCDPIDYTVPEILQARILERVAIPFSRRSSQPRDQTQVSRTADGFFTSWATREALRSPSLGQKAVLTSQDSIFSLHWSASCVLCTALGRAWVVCLHSSPEGLGQHSTHSGSHMLIICWL